VNLSRRALLIMPFAPRPHLTEPNLPVRRVARPPYIDLVYERGLLTWPGGSTRATCGKGGVRADKREGDGSSPAGTFKLVSALYRADRMTRQPSGVRLAELKPEDGWVDDPQDPNYNRLVTLPYDGHHETLWRDDGIYDLIVVIGYNTDPVVPGAGSAIFLHIARPDYSPTEGCIAIAREVLPVLLGLLGPESFITIRA
jgi:L,D-peptidoglycan transpeptidase YkuD (ErfK/YbiS/YcfS/YnhG family)